MQTFIRIYIQKITNRLKQKVRVQEILILVITQRVEKKDKLYK